MRHEMKARNAKKLVTTSERFEELTPAELTEVSGGYGYGYGYGYGRRMPFYGGFRYGGFRYGMPFYRRPRYQQVYNPYF
jgi:hypothetical protein